MTNQPLSEYSTASIEGVIEPVNIRSIFADNMAALMMDRWGEVNTNRLARETGLGAATIQRIKDETADFRVDAVSKIAAALRVDPWQMLVSELTPKSMPRLDRRTISPLALDLASYLERITDPAIRQRAYAAALVVISLASDLPASAPPPLPAD